MSQRSLAKRLWYGFLHITCRLGSVIFFHTRVSGRDNIPQTGGALVMSNHQSNFDPVLVGLASHRRLNFLARLTLFRFPPFRWLIHSLDSIPIDRDGTGLGGLKETLSRLKRGELVLMFPEGTRTRDGDIAPLKPGFVAIARRAGVPLLPVAIDGAFQAWPRWRKLPGRSIIHIAFGPPVEPVLIARLDDEQLVAEIAARMQACFEIARQGRHRAGANYQEWVGNGSCEVHELVEITRSQNPLRAQSRPLLSAQRQK
jgi:1-acyl-sn-glycerol-3-phosphate acyltransferase